MKSASDEKLESILNILKSEMTNDEKIIQIRGLVDYVL